MSTDADDTADYPPEHGSPLVSATPQAAQIRGGERAPAHDHGGLPADTAKLDEVLARTRNLFQMRRNDIDAFNDPEYHHLRPWLGTLYRRLKADLRDQIDNDDLIDMLFEVMSYLPRKDL